MTQNLRNCSNRLVRFVSPTRPAAQIRGDCRRLPWLCVLALLWCLGGVASAGLVQQPDAPQDPSAEQPASGEQAVQPPVATAPDPGLNFVRMPADQIRPELLTWLTTAGASSEITAKISEVWSDDDRLARLTGEELLDLLVTSFAEVDVATERLVEETYGAGPVQGVIYDGIRSATIYRHQVQQYHARWLVQHRYYDEALPLLTELPAEDVIDPAGLLFYRALCQSQLLLRRDAINSLTLLLHYTLDVPDRFRVVAEMLQKDLAGQKDDGMDQVALLMKDVERRLDLGRSGEKTQEQEEAVIAALDKLLEELDEQNQQQNSAGGSGSSQQNQSGTQGASRSQIKGSPAAGEADQKDLTETGKWGMLDQQAEAQARELIRQKFPPNFLDQIGRYTRKLAEQKK
ncbi:MAG: hypothetical protein RIK87_12420 [Fuerstiella sp.]